MKLFIRYLLISTLLSSFYFLTSLPDNRIHIIVCDVGQGDAILILQGFTQVLIDGGPDDRVSSCLSNHIPWFDTHIEMVVLTHPHADHLAGLPPALSRYTTGLFVANDVMGSSRSFASLRELIWQKEIPTLVPRGGELIQAGSMTFKVLLPLPTSNLSRENTVWRDDYSIKIDQVPLPQPYTGDLNETSLVLEMHYQDVSMLLTGDMTTREEQALITRGVITPVDVLKVAHHGSKYSSDRHFLDLTSPKWALVSVGEDNRYGHPDREVLMYLDAVGAKVLRTDVDGEIELVSDGITVNQSL